MGHITEQPHRSDSEQFSRGEEELMQPGDWLAVTPQLSSESSSSLSGLQTLQTRSAQQTCVLYSSPCWDIS